MLFRKKLTSFKNMLKYNNFCDNMNVILGIAVFTLPCTFTCSFVFTFIVQVATVIRNILRQVMCPHCTFDGKVFSVHT